MIEGTWILSDCWIISGLLNTLKSGLWSALRVYLKFPYSLVTLPINIGQHKNSNISKKYDFDMGKIQKDLLLWLGYQKCRYYCKYCWMPISNELVDTRSEHEDLQVIKTRMLRWQYLQNNTYFIFLRGQYDS